MKTKSLSNVLVLGIPLLIISFLFLLIKSEYYLNEPDVLIQAITLDFLITIPLIYGILIWKKDIPKFTIISAFIISMIAASYILPENQQDLLKQVKCIAVPVLEIGVLSFLIFKMRSISKSFSKTGKENLDFYDKLKIACQSAFPGRVGDLFATEVAVIRYALFPPKKKELKSNEFTYYKKSGIMSIIAVLLGLVTIEVIVVHLIVAKSNEKLAWILTAIGLYAFVQVFSLVRSMARRHIEIDSEQNTLHLRYGFFAQVSIPFESIIQIEKNKKSLPQDKSIIKLSTLDMLDTHNTIIHLNKEHTLEKIYGIKIQFKAIAIFLDYQDEFIEQLEAVKN